jgi:ATP-binding cassette subfamily F protein 3
VKKPCGACSYHVKTVNFLVLDEPTNHLDIQSREILLGILREFAGTIAIVSHDRFFLRSLVDHVFEIDRGQMTHYKGGYEYYLSKTGRDHRAV